MFEHNRSVHVCLFASLVISFPAHAQEVTPKGPGVEHENVRPWADPPSAKTPPVASDDRSQDRPATLEVRFRQLEERVAIIAQDLRAEGRRLSLAVRVKAALREADDLETQARIERETTLELVAKAEALKARLAAIERDRDRSDTSRDVAVAPTRESPPASVSGQTSLSQADRSSFGAGTAKDGTGKAGQVSSVDTARKRPIRSAQNTAIGDKPVNRRAFVLPGALQPIRF